MENLRIKVVEVVSMTERVEATTADGKYCMSGERVTNNGNVTDFGGGGRDQGRGWHRSGAGPGVSPRHRHDSAIQSWV